MPLVCLGVCGFLAIPTLALHVPHAQSKPVHEFHHTYDTGPPAATLDELIDNSRLIVDGVITAEHPDDLVYPDTDPSKPPAAVFVMTYYDVTVRGIFKKPTPLPPNVTIQMRLPGGRRDRGSFIEDDFPVTRESGNQQQTDRAHFPFFR